MNKRKGPYCYEDSSGTYGVTIPNKLINKLRRFCDKAYPYETGGILIGHYSSDRKWAEIVSITAASDDAKSTPFSFVRNSLGLTELLNKLWDKHQYYLGEWHYHPGSSSAPSTMDLHTMQDLSESESLYCPEPILLIIGGKEPNWSESVHVFVRRQVIPML